MSTKPEKPIEVPAPPPMRKGSDLDESGITITNIVVAIIIAFSLGFMMMVIGTSGLKERDAGYQKLIAECEKNLPRQIHCELKADIKEIE